MSLVLFRRKYLNTKGHHICNQHIWLKGKNTVIPIIHGFRICESAYLLRWNKETLCLVSALMVYFSRCVLFVDFTT